MNFSADADFAASAASAAFLEHPLGFIDVGARGGAHAVIAPLGELASVLAFEPDPEEFSKLQRTMHHVEPWALSHKAGIAEFKVFNCLTNSSLLRPNELYTKRYSMKTKWTTVKTVRVQTTTLDKILFGPRKRERHWGEFVKLDTQGTEHDILRGAARTLKERTVAVLCEVEFFPIYKGQKLFSEVELFLRKMGFSFYGLHGLHCRSSKLLNKSHQGGRERLFHSDAVFFKDPFSGGSKLSMRGLHALFVTTLLLGYYDFALEIALGTWARGAEGRRLRRFVRRLAEKEPAALQADFRSLSRITSVAVGKFLDRWQTRLSYEDVPEDGSAE